MRHLFIVIGLFLLTFINGGCNKKHDEPKPEDYFYCNGIEAQDTSKIKQYLIGRWKMTASLGGFPGSFHIVQEADTATYLVVYPDSTFEQYQEGHPIVRTPYHLYFNKTSASGNLGYGGSLWFCDSNTLIISDAYLDGPTIRYKRVR